MATIVPLFALYGEDIWQSELDPIHVEPIATRSGLHNWEIEPHRHGDLHQLTWVTRGEGVLHIEGRTEAFAAPRLMVLPAGVAHGFTWAPDSDGQVVMLGADLMRGLAPAEEHGLWERPRALSPPPALAARIDEAMARLQAEFARIGAGRRAGLLGGVLQLHGLIAQSADLASRMDAPISSEAELVGRFRAVIEQRYRDQPDLAAYCAALGVTPARLSRACHAAAGRSPIALVHDRLMLEARRALTYTAMGVSEIAYALGFSDPAYFSRFFAKREGASPAAFRARRAAV